MRSSPTPTPRSWASRWTTWRRRPKFAESLNLPFPLLADPEGVAAKAYGVANPAGYANRVTFVIEKDGKISKVIEGKDAIDPDAHARAPAGSPSLREVGGV